MIHGYTLCNTIWFTNCESQCEFHICIKLCESHDNCKWHCVVTICVHGDFQSQVVWKKNTGTIVFTILLNKKSNR